MPSSKCPLPARAAADAGVGAGRDEPHTAHPASDWPVPHLAPTVGAVERRPPQTVTAARAVLERQVLTEPSCLEHAQRTPARLAAAAMRPLHGVGRIDCGALHPPQTPVEVLVVACWSGPLDQGAL